MKKMFIAMITLMVMVAAVNAANAELYMKPYKVDSKKACVLHDGTVVWDRIYYAKIISSVEERIVEVSKNEYEKLVSENDTTSSTEKKSFFANVASVATFWNPND